MRIIEIGAGQSIHDALARALSGEDAGSILAEISVSSGGDRRRLHETSIEETIADKEVLAGVQPSVRDVVRIDDRHAFIKLAEQDEGDPHSFLLIRHPSKPDRWRLWNLCPRGIDNSARYRMRGTFDEALVKANLAIDLSQGAKPVIDRATEILMAQRAKKRKAKQEQEDGDDD